MANYWNSEEIFLDGDQYFDRLIQDIDLAKEYITVEIYIFSFDPLGKKVAQHLLEAHRRGVTIQIMVDGIGTYDYFEHYQKLFYEAKVAVKIFHPLPFYHPIFEKMIFKKKIQTFFGRLWKLNQRNHRKIITIDYQVMYLGSFNFSAIFNSSFTYLSASSMLKFCNSQLKSPNITTLSESCLAEDNLSFKDLIFSAS